MNLKKVVLVFLIYAIEIYSSFAKQTGIPTMDWTPIFYNVDYRTSHLKINKTKKILIHQIRINLNKSGAIFFITPIYDREKNYLLSETTSSFLKKYNLQIAINGQGFGPARPFLPDLPKKVCGLAVASGTQYGRICKEKYMFAVFKNSTIDILKVDNYHPVSKDVHMGISGWTHVNHPDLLLEEGKINPYFLNKNITKNFRKARTSIGISANKEFIYLVVCENINKGLTLNELSQFMKKLGAHYAINLDGGGSSTMVIQNNKNSSFIVNALEKNFERPVANHLGIYAKHLDP